MISNANMFEGTREGDGDKGRLLVAPLEWGNQAHVDNIMATIDYKQFDVLFHAELLWKDTYPLHDALLTSTRILLRDGGLLLVSFAHRPSSSESHMPANDLEFFAKAASVYGFSAPVRLLCSSKYKDADTDPNSSFEVCIYALYKIS
jgi:hypothetical protein